MRLRYLLPLLVVLVFAGCGGHKETSAQKAKSALHSLRAARSPAARVNACDKLPEGYGRMGVCVQAAPAPRTGLLPPPASGVVVRGIDTSHWDYCSSAIVRAPQFWFVALGDGSYIDRCAPVVYAMLKRAGIPHGFYYFVRPGYSAQWSADRATYLARQAGWSPQDGKTLVFADDAEAIFNCATIHGFDALIAKDLGLRRVIDYDSPGLWPGCAGGNNLDWTAQYGGFFSRLAGFTSVWVWQHTDGQVGAPPHCWGVCGDVDLLLGKLSDGLTTKPAPPSPPIPYTYWQSCGALDAITFWKLHGGHGKVSPAQHRHAVAIRARLRHDHIGCQQPGWRLKPPQAYVSFPYRKSPPKYLPRPGALA